MLEAVRVLAVGACEHSDKLLENIAREFGNNCPIQCTIPVGVLLRARKEYEILGHPQAAVTTCARIVALAEELVDAEKNDFQGKFLALSREIDNLRSYSRAAAKKAGLNPG